MQNDGTKTLFLELADGLVKSWWTVIAGVCFGLAAAQLALSYMPKVYESSTMVRIAPPSIPERMLNTTVTEDMAERLLAVEQAILSREYMVELIESTYGPAESPQALESQISGLRSDITVLTDRRAGMFSLIFQDSDAQMCADVVNTLTKLYVDQNAEFRAGRAKETADTFATLAEQARKEVEAAEQALNEFKAQHPFETEEHLDFNLRLKESRLRELESKRSERGLVEDRVRTLETQRRLLIENATVPGLPVGDGVVADPDYQRLAALERELVELRTNYTEKHPEVQRTLRQIEDLRARLAGRGPESEAENPEVPVDPRLASVDAEIGRAQAEIVQIGKDEDRLRREIAEIERKIRVTPERQRALSELEHNYGQARTKHSDLQAKAKMSADSVFLESEQKGERLEVLEWAAVPFSPISPQPLAIMAVCIAAGLAFFVGPMLAGRALNPVILSESGLRALTDVPVLIGIPRLPTPQTARTVRNRWMRNIGLSAVAVAVVVAVSVGLQ